jgi:hypothetical protein
MSKYSILLLTALVICAPSCATRQQQSPLTQRVVQTGLVRSSNGTLYRKEDAPPGCVPVESHAPLVASNKGRASTPKRERSAGTNEMSRGRQILFGALIGLAAGANAYNQGMANSSITSAPLYQPMHRRAQNYPRFGSGSATYTAINNSVYGPDGVHQRIGNYWYHPDGTTTNKIGNFYYHSDGTTTQRIGNYWYHPDGTTTNKIGNFYYHSDGTTSQQIGNTLYRN